MCAELHEVLKSDNVSNFSAFLESHSVNMTIERNNELPSMLRYSPPLICLAAYFGSRQCFSLLQSKGASLTSFDLFRTPVTHFAAAGGSLRICKHLLSAHLSFAGAIFPAIEHGRSSIVEWLFSHELVQQTETDARGFSPLCVAVENGDLRILQIVCREMPYQSDPKLSLVCYALNLGNVDAARYLISLNGFNPSETDANKNTPLHLACKLNDKELVSQILRLKNVNVKATNADVSFFFTECSSFLYKTPAELTSDDKIKEMLSVREEIPSRPASVAARPTGRIESKTCCLV